MAFWAEMDYSPTELSSPASIKSRDTFEGRMQTGEPPLVPQIAITHPPPSMPPASSVVTPASSMDSSSDISLPSSPSPSPEPSADPYAFSSSDEAAAAPQAKKKNRGGLGRRTTWPTADEVVLLEAVAAHKDQHGGLPSRRDLAAALAGRLPYTAEQAALRVHALRYRYYGSVSRLRRGTVPVTDDDMRVFRLSKRIWEGVPRREQRRRPRAAPHHERRDFAELQGMYPCLASVVEAIDAKCVAAGVMRMAFGRMGDEQAAELEAKAKKQRLAQLKADVRRAELSNLVARTLLGSVE